MLVEWTVVISMQYQSLSLQFPVTGHYMTLSSTDTRPGYSARLQTSYINTTGYCIELYFSSLRPSTSSAATSTASVILISEEKDESVLITSTGLEPTFVWNRLFAALPNGIYQVAIEGRRHPVGLSSISIDDISILPCNRYGKFCVKAELWHLERIYTEYFNTHSSYSHIIGLRQ